jgi:hypothetical protein
VTVLVVALAREVAARMAIHAARMTQDLGHPGKGLQRLLGLGVPRLRGRRVSPEHDRDRDAN